jgi:hypothetical protein
VKRWSIIIEVSWPQCQYGSSVPVFGSCHCWEETRNLTWPRYPDNWGPCEASRVNNNLGVIVSVPDEAGAPMLHAGWGEATRHTTLTRTEAKVGSGPLQIVSYLSIFYLRIARPQPAKPLPPTSRGQRATATPCHLSLPEPTYPPVRHPPAGHPYDLPHLSLATTPQNPNLKKFKFWIFFCLDMNKIKV